jgi:hypothetical protein
MIAAHKMHFLILGSKYSTTAGCVDIWPGAFLVNVGLSAIEAVQAGKLPRHLAISTKIGIAIYRTGYVILWQGLVVI